MALVHHELCFGCGRINLFGLLLEAQRDAADPDRINGRCFVKQDHQGPTRGQAHSGILATALMEAMELLAGDELVLDEVVLEIAGQAPVGAFLELSARREGLARVIATVSADDDQVASARGSLKPCP